MYFMLVAFLCPCVFMSVCPRRQMKSMEVEVRTLDARHKSKCTQMLAQFRADIATQKKHFDRLQVRAGGVSVCEYRVIESSGDM